MTSQQIASRPGCCNAKLTQVQFAYDFEAKTGLVAGQYITEARIDVLYRFVCLVSYRPRQQLGYIADGSQDWCRKFCVLPHMRQSGETMISFSAGHIILAPTQPVGSGRPQRESNPGPLHQETLTLPTELPRPHTLKENGSPSEETILGIYLLSP